MTEMKPLPTEFSSRGFRFEQVARSGDIALFRKFKDTWKNQEHFEVFEVQKHESRLLPNGKMSEPRELPPTDAMWGKKGFSYSTEKETRKKFLEMCA